MGVRSERSFSSVRAMAHAVDAYIRSIKTLVPVYKVDHLGSYVRDASGNKIHAVDLDGKEIFVEEYVTPPQLGGICKAIGISRQTWARYASGEYGEDFATFCGAVKDECERYLVSELITRQKGVDGIKFNLQHNYGWGGDKRELDLSERAEKALTTAEKLEAIKQIPSLLEAFGVEDN